jgi:hypothetical protein
MSTNTDREKSAVLLGRQVAQPFETEPLDELGDVDEVARLGAVEQREELVRPELFERQDRSERPAVGRTTAGTRCSPSLPMDRRSRGPSSPDRQSA